MKKKKPHKCHICKYSCSRNSTLTAHVESAHEGKKPYRCSICDYNFSQKNNLKAHVESVHENVKPYNCVICNYSCFEKGWYGKVCGIGRRRKKKRKSQVHYLQLQLFKKGYIDWQNMLNMCMKESRVPFVMSVVHKKLDLKGTWHLCMKEINLTIVLCAVLDAP